MPFLAATRNAVSVLSILSLGLEDFFSLSSFSSSFFSSFELWITLGNRCKSSFTISFAATRNAVSVLSILSLGLQGFFSLSSFSSSFISSTVSSSFISSTISSSISLITRKGKYRTS
ncbi:hypothetical protein V8G54_037454 [Vigna mungo]|uniref:Uncharacterized protein n=1 Tax=Vigna mungo TaxID=3915 RepID=A0AAQ3MJA0_VIGMU